MDKETYNGWRNYATWCVYLWLDNEHGSHEHYRERALELLRENGGKADEAVTCLAEELRSDHEEAMPELRGVWTDLLNSALGDVDWREIAGHFVQAAIEERAYELGKKGSDV